MDASEKTKYKLAGAVRELMVFTPVDRIGKTDRRAV